MPRALRIPKGRIALPSHPPNDNVRDKIHRAALMAIRAGRTQRQAVNACSVMFRHSPSVAMLNDARETLRKKFGGVATADRILRRAEKRKNLVTVLER